jgi:TRAP-type C4-dicarboxylate transport system substrate-binding protein
MKKPFYCLLMIVLVGVFCLGVGSPVMAKVKTLTAVSFLPKDHPLCAMIHVWIDQVNEACKDSVKIRWVGGPEVIAGFDQASACINNTVQIIFNPTAYFAPLAPEVNAFSLSRLTFQQERKPGGFYDFMQKRIAKIGMMYIGTWLYDPFYLRVNRPVKTLADLKGLKMRTSALYDRFMKMLGMVPVTVKFGDTYTALERGLVDGFGWATLGPAEWGWLNHCKYIIDIPFYTRQNTLILMNLGVWNGLSEDVQKKIMDITPKFESEMEAYFKGKEKEEWDKYDKMGIVRIKFSPEENEKYYNMAYEAEWKDLEKKVPDLVPVMKRLTGN